MNKEELELYVKKAYENIFKKLAENPEEMLNLSDLQDKYNNLLKEKIELKEQIKKQKDDNQHLHNLNNTIFRELLNKKYENKKQKEAIDKAIKNKEEIMYLANKVAITTQNIEAKRVRDILEEILDISKEVSE